MVSTATETSPCSRAARDPALQVREAADEWYFSRSIFGRQAAFLRASTRSCGLPSACERRALLLRLQLGRSGRPGRRPRRGGLAQIGAVRGHAAARRPAFDDERDGVDRVGVGAGLFGDAAHQRVELHRLAEADGGGPVDRLQREVVDRHVERHLAAELHQLARDARLLGELQQVLAPLRLLDLAGAGEQRFEVAELVEELRRSLRPDARDARHVVGGIADQRLQLDHLLRPDAEFLVHEIPVDHLVAHRVDHGDARPHQLHQVLVGGDDGDGGAGPVGLQRIGRDQVVRLPALLLDAGEVEGARRLADQAELRDEVGGRVGPVRLVIGVELVAKRLGRIVEDDGEMRGLVAGRLGRPFLHQLPDHVAEAGDRADRQAVGFARQRRQRVEGAEDEGRAVDQDEVVAGFERGLGGGGGGG